MTFEYLVFLFCSDCFVSFECSAISLFYKEIQLFIYLVGQVIYGSINANFSILYATMNVNLTLYLMLLKNTYLMLNSSKKKNFISNAILSCI